MGGIRCKLDTRCGQLKKTWGLMGWALTALHKSTRLNLYMPLQEYYANTGALKRACEVANGGKRVSAPVCHPHALIWILWEVF